MLLVTDCVCIMLYVVVVVSIFFLLKYKIETIILYIEQSIQTMASLNKQLILSGLPIPEELIRIIKDYTFMDIVMSDSKWKKDVIMRTIKQTVWCGRARPKDETKGKFVYWIESSSRQFQCDFCKKCGNYTSESAESIYCVC
jgi:hypothetical protein